MLVIGQQKREVEFDKYQSDKLVMAKNEFRSLLKESKFITYKSRDLVRESERHYKDIINLLKVRVFQLVLIVYNYSSFRMISDI